MASHYVSIPKKGTLPLTVDQGDFGLSQNKNAAIDYFIKSKNTQLIYPIANPEKEEQSKEEIEKLNEPLTDKEQEIQAKRTLPDFDKVKAKKQKLL